MKPLLLGLGGLAMLAGILFWLGVYDVSATRQHWAPTYWLIDLGMRRSVIARARAIEVPALDDPVLVARGFARFREHCVQCHGAPGVAPLPFALGLSPAPANLVHTAREWTAAQVYVTVRDGIRMTGMPAWSFRLPDWEIWAIVAFMRVLPALSPEAYQRLAAEGPSVGVADPHSRPDAPVARPDAPGPRADAPGPAPATPDARRGKQAIYQYLCVTCHAIPGIVGANAPVGPPLDGTAARSVIAGVLPNSPDNLVRWLRTPQAFSAHNAMPDLGVTEGDAADIAAYLRTLRR